MQNQELRLNMKKINEHIVVKQLNTYIAEKLTINKNLKTEKSIDDEIEEWERRMEEPYGKALKELQKIVIKLGLWGIEKDEYGMNVYTPFDSYITAFALDYNKGYTYKKIKSICDDYDWTENHKEIKNALEKIKSLI